MTGSAFTSPLFLCRILKSYLTDVNRVWHTSLEELQQYQSKMLRRMVEYAYTVPLYHEKYKKEGVRPGDIRGTRDAHKIPYVTKKDFRGQTADMLLPVGADPVSYTHLTLPTN